MFRRYPYWGWLLLSIFLWCAACWHFYDNTRAMQPAAMAQRVSKDLQHKEDQLKEFLANRPLIRQAFAQTLTSDEVRTMNDYPFYVYAFDRDTLIFWNNNKILPVWNDAGPEPQLLKYNRGYYLGRSLSLPFLNKDEHLFVLFPVVTLYPFENDYLKSHFEAADYIPVSAQVLSKPVKNSYAVTGKDNKPLLYLQFIPQDLPHWLPDSIMIGLLILALIVSVSWLQLITIFISRKKGFAWGLSLTLIVVIGLRALIYIFGLPFSLEGIQFFSPRLYASSTFLNSLGDLALNTLCLLWIGVFIVRHTPYKMLVAGVKNKALKYILGLLFSFLLVYYTFGFVNVIRNLILDSNISFDLGHFDSINRYTIIGLFIITIITGLSCVVVYFLNIQVNTLFRVKWLKYILVIAIDRKSVV